MRQGVLAFAVVVAFAIGCGESSDEPGSDSDEREKLTAGEFYVPVLASGAATYYCEPSQGDAVYGANADAGFENLLELSVGGLELLAKDKPDAIYDDTYGLGRVTMTQFLRVVADDLRGCGALGDKLATELIETANQLPAPPP